MANELQVGAQGGLTIYAIVRRYADQYAWNNTSGAWEAWSDGDLAEYVISLASAGGDLYVGNFPATIAVGTRALIFFYSQVGGSPATSDLKLGPSLDRTWNGVALSSGSSVAPDPYALTYLASVKDYLRINQNNTAYDTQLQRIINQITYRIERYCGRHFAARSYAQRYTGDNERRLVLREWPIISIDRLCYGNAGAMNVTYNGSNLGADLEVTTSAISLRNVSTLGVVSTIVLPFATYPTTDLMAAAINAQGGYVASSLLDMPMTDVHPMSGTSCISNTPPLTYGNIDMVAYAMDFERGMIMVRWDTFFPYLEGLTYGARFPRLFKGILVYYSAGYTSIPQDLEGVANQIVGRVWREGTRDLNLASEKIGDYQYNMAGRLAVIDAEREALAPYRDITVGGRA